MTKLGGKIFRENSTVTLHTKKGAKTLCEQRCMRKIKLLTHEVFSKMCVLKDMKLQCFEANLLHGGSTEIFDCNIMSSKE